MPYPGGGVVAEDAGLEMKDRLRGDLLAALRQKHMRQAKLLRTLIAALDNAEAPASDVGNGTVQLRFEDGSAEIERKTLSFEQVQSVLTAELVELESAIAQMLRLGNVQRADELRTQVCLVTRYLA